MDKQFGPNTKKERWVQRLRRLGLVSDRKEGTNRDPAEGCAQKDVGPTAGSFTDHAADDAVAGISGRVARVIILSGVNDDCGPPGLKH
jgi:hypothetical protein